VLCFEGDWWEGLAHSGTLFPDGNWHGQKKFDGSPKYPLTASITPIRWQAGQRIPNTDVPGWGSGKLHECLRYEGLLVYLPHGALGW